MFGTNSSLTYTKLVFCVRNSEPSVSKALKAFEAVSTGTRNQFRILGGEDFGYYTLSKPGCFIYIGCGSPGHDGMLHDSKFNLDERAMLVGASWWVTLAENELG